MPIYKVEFSDQVVTRYEVFVEADSLYNAQQKAYISKFYSDPVFLNKDFEVRTVYFKNLNPIDPNEEQIVPKLPDPLINNL